MKLWIFIWRMQPLHMWHQKIIEKSLEENNLTFIILGSSEVLDDRNIFTNEQRLKLLKLFLNKKTRNKILFLEDTKSDKQWVENLNSLIEKTWDEYLKHTLSRLMWWKNINSEDIEFQKQDFSSQVEKVTFYWGDLENDYAIQIIKEYENLLNFKDIKYLEISREEIPISSTQIREELKNNNYVALQKILHPKILKEIKNITLAK